MIHALVNGLSTLKDSGMIHGDIQPSTIHINRSSEIELLPNLLISDGMTGYHKMILEKPEGYRAPISPL